MSAQPLQFLLLVFAGWVNRRQLDMIEYLKEENRVLREQLARNLVDVFDGFLKAHRTIILDRDPLFTRDFRGILRNQGVKALRLPARSPNLNAFAERFVLTIKSECLSRIVPLGQRHLRRAVRQFIEHYHLERNHQGLATDSSSRRNSRLTKMFRSSAASASEACSTTTTAPRRSVPRPRPDLAPRHESRGAPALSTPRQPA